MKQFRAWDIFNAEMFFHESNYGGLSAFFNEVYKRAHGGNHIEVMQYTGLKDVNDKEICEGDIIKISTDIGVVQYVNDIGLYEVQFKNGSRAIHGFNKLQEKEKRPPEFILDVSVIGNIYENYELVNKEKLK